MQAILKQSSQEVESIAEDCRSFTDKNHAELHAHAEALAQQCDEFVQRALEKANALLAEAAERMGEKAPAPMTLEDIAPRLARQREVAEDAAERMKLPSA